MSALEPPGPRLLLETGLGFSFTSCGLVGIRLATELDDHDLCGEAGDPCFGVEENDSLQLSGLVGPDIETSLVERAVDCENFLVAASLVRTTTSL